MLFIVYLEMVVREGVAQGESRRDLPIPARCYVIEQMHGPRLQADASIVYLSYDTYFLVLHIHLSVKLRHLFT